MLNLIKYIITRIVRKAISVINFILWVTVHILDTRPIMWNGLHNIHAPIYGTCSYDFHRKPFSSFVRTYYSPRGTLYHGGCNADRSIDISWLLITAAIWRDYQQLTTHIPSTLYSYKVDKLKGIVASFAPDWQLSRVHHVVITAYETLIFMELWCSSGMMPCSSQMKINNLIRKLNWNARTLS